MAISSIHFDANHKGHEVVIKLINDFASFRPAIPATTLIEELLLDELPKRIKKEQAKRQGCSR